MTLRGDNAVTTLQLTLNVPIFPQTPSCCPWRSPPLTGRSTSADAPTVPSMMPTHCPGTSHSRKGPSATLPTGHMPPHTAPFCYPVPVPSEGWGVGWDAGEREGPTKMLMPPLSLSSLSAMTYRGSLGTMRNTQACLSFWCGLGWIRFEKRFFHLAAWSFQITQVTFAWSPLWLSSALQLTDTGHWTTSALRITRQDWVGTDLARMGAGTQPHLNQNQNGLLCGLCPQRTNKHTDTEDERRKTKKQQRDKTNKQSKRPTGLQCCVWEAVCDMGPIQRFMTRRIGL